jgi:hypothetical protein
MCDTVNSKLCCKESPFEVSADGTKWARAPMAISGETVNLTPPAAMTEAGTTLQFYGLLSLGFTKYFGQYTAHLD